MTHGEELGSETHQDSAVLTYLEGLLMHQVAGGPGATGARRSEAGGREVQEQRALPLRPGGHGTAHQEQDPRAAAGGASQHLRKARLLRSEAWAGELEAGGLRALGSEPALNGRGGEQHHHHHGGALEGSPKCKGGESTLLASLLQSFSSRLQTVALSQQIMQNLKPPEPATLDQGANGDAVEPRPCLGTASSRLKGLLKKSKIQNHSSVPYRRRAGQERPAESPQPLTAGGKGASVAAATAASDSLSCAARLKAVASLVNTRSSPAPSPSPRPSVACSQLALLLSSEAHLQQYSREQALKAQLSGRSASERLAAMATQQSQHDHSKQAPPAPGASGSFGNARNGALSPPGPSAVGGVASPRRTPQPPKERRAFDRNSARPSQNCSSLLLHLLNNHNAQKRANGHGGPGDGHGACPSRGSPLLSDSEYSNPETSLPRDSSDTESSCSSSSPMDLSVRGRAAGPLLGSSSSASSSFSSSSSLDKLTESLINRWRPENPAPVVEEREAEMGSPVRPHHKVTLLQLLLDHRDGEGKRAKTSSGSPDSRQGVAPKPGRAPLRLGMGPAVGTAAGRLTPVSRGEERLARSPHGGLVGRGFQALPSFPQGQDSNGGVSQYSQRPPPPPAQSTPLNLCKSKAPSSPGADTQDPAFTASKLLQNLAQCGLQSSASSSEPLKTPLPPAPLRADPPVTLLERLNAPILRNGTPVSDVPLGLMMSDGSPVSEPSGTNAANLASPPSEIESLLERRTVLQLLLGSAGGKEKPSAGSGRRKRPVCGGAPSEQRPVEPNRCSSSPDVKIKAEPTEDCQPAVDGEDVKPKPASPGAIARDGLLSQLLKQQCRSLPVNIPAAGLMTVKEEPSEPGTPPSKPQTPPSEFRTPPNEHQAPPSEPQAPPIPKKRRVCVEGFSQERPVIAAGGKIGGDARRFVSRSPERLAAQNGGSPKEVGSPSRGCMGNSPPADARGGFNVLKQLLLSDNCLKDLSQLQPRGTPSPSALQPSDGRANGTPSGRPGYLRELVASHRDHGVAGHPHSGSPPWGIRDSPKVNLVPVKRKAEAEGPIRWVVGVEEGPDEHPDSPRLTKANPILYYMLQKGSHLGRESRALRAGLCRGGPQAQPRVKEEPDAHAEDDDLKLNTKHHLDQPEEAPESAIERLNGSLKKC